MLGYFFCKILGDGQKEKRKYVCIKVVIDKAAIDTIGRAGKGKERVYHISI